MSCWMIDIAAVHFPKMLYSCLRVFGPAFVQQPTEPNLIRSHQDARELVTVNWACLQWLNCLLTPMTHTFCAPPPTGRRHYAMMRVWRLSVAYFWQAIIKRRCYVTYVIFVISRITANWRVVDEFWWHFWRGGMCELINQSINQSIIIFLEWPK